MSGRMSGVLVFMGFAVTLAYFLGTRLSPEALSVAIGVLFGMAASVPVSLGLLIALTRQRERSDDDRPRMDEHPVPYGSPRPQAPQIIVVAPPQAQYGAGQMPYGYPTANPNMYPGFPPEQYQEVVDGRDWRIIGDDA